MVLPVVSLEFLTKKVPYITSEKSFQVSLLMNCD
jgi:hypothetical protein